MGSTNGKVFQNEALRKGAAVLPQEWNLLR